MGTKFEGDCFFRGIDFMGIVCLGGQEVGAQMSGDQLSLGPNVLQPNLYDFQKNIYFSYNMITHILFKLNS